MCVRSLGSRFRARKEELLLQFLCRLRAPKGGNRRSRYQAMRLLFHGHGRGYHREPHGRRRADEQLTHRELREARWSQCQSVRVALVGPECETPSEDRSGERLRTAQTDDGRPLGGPTVGRGRAEATPPGRLATRPGSSARRSRCSPRVCARGRDGRAVCDSWGRPWEPLQLDGEGLHGEQVRHLHYQLMVPRLRRKGRREDVRITPDLVVDDVDVTARPILVLQAATRAQLVRQ